MPGRCRIQKQPRRFARAGRQHHGTRTHSVLLHIVPVNVRHTGSQSLLICGDLPRHGIVHDGQPTRTQGRRQQYRRRGKIGTRGAAAPALCTEVTGCSAIVRLRQNRKAVRQDRDTHFCSTLHHEQFVQTRRRRRQKVAVRLVVKTVPVTENSDELIDFVVPRRHVVVPYGPVVPKAVEAVSAEVVRTEPQRNAPPVVRTPAQHARPEPIPLRAGRVGVRLALDLPAADAPVELPKRLLFRIGPSPRRSVVPGKHVAVRGGVPHRAGFQHNHIRARLGKHVRRHAPSGAGADHSDIVYIGADDVSHGGQKWRELCRKYTNRFGAQYPSPAIRPVVNDVCPSDAIRFRSFPGQSLRSPEISRSRRAREDCGTPVR